MACFRTLGRMPDLALDLTFPSKKNNRPRSDFLHVTHSFIIKGGPITMQSFSGGCSYAVRLNSVIFGKIISEKVNIMINVLHVILTCNFELERLCNMLL